MAIFTGKGDDGTTSLFGSNERISKASCQTRALGALDEINTLIGVCKAKSRNFACGLGESSLADILEDVQQDLFVIQAVVAGSPKSLGADRVKRIEDIIVKIERELPPMKTFFLSGGTELSSLLDYARAVARRVERVFVGCPKVERTSGEIIRYLNRLSSLLYILTRFINRKQGVQETTPSY